MIRVALLLPLLLLAAPLAAGEPLPRIEVGIGAGLLSRPDYPGSASVSTTVYPIPYFAYRDDRLELSRDGLMARLFNTDDVRLGLSASAALPGNDSQDGARRGMPRLLPTFELGPTLDWRFSEAGGHWDLRLPVRAVAATDLSQFEGIGWLSFPHLGYSQTQQLGRWLVSTAFDAGPLWASRRFHRYFYAVESRFATADRPAYEPDAGYGGARIKAYLGLRQGPWRAAVGITYDTLAGAAMRDSPLVETDRATFIGVGVFYSLWEKW